MIASQLICLNSLEGVADLELGDERVERVRVAQPRQILQPGVPFDDWDLDRRRPQPSEGRSLRSITVQAAGSGPTGSSSVKRSSSRPKSVGNCSVSSAAQTTR